MIALFMLSILVIIALALAVFAIRQGDGGCFGIAFFLTTIALMITLGNIYFLPNGYVGEFYINNTNNVPVKITYMQHHPFFENTVEKIIVMPNDGHLLRKVKFLAESPLKLD